jgi:Holliday junction resolvase YEN1
LRTNESGFFRTRHKALEIPETFPNMEILRYYTHPVVSQGATMERLKSEFPSASTVDIVGLREFSRETFDWDFKIGAVKFIRVLAPSLLVQQFLERYVSPESHHDDLNLKEKEESALVRAISSKRAHFSTDATPELRISFVPANIVKLDLDREPEEEVEAFGRSGIALNSDDEFDEEAEELDAEQPKSSSVRKPFDPLQPELIWIPETLAKLGIPLAVEDWEGKQRLKEQRVAAKGTRKTRAKKTDMPVGALDKYVKVTKNAADSATKAAPRLELASSPPRISSQCGPPAPKGRSKQSKKTSTSSQAKPPADVNPWTLASSHASPRAPRPLPPPASQAQPKHSSASDPIILSSSPAAPASPAPRSASVRRGQTTPTRPKRASPPVEDVPSPAPLFSPSPSPRKQRFPVPDEPAEEESCAAEVQPRKARPFKRVKSGAADTAKVSTTQKSIKSFGRVMKSTASSRINTKGAVPDTQPIEILSDDEEFALPLLKQASASVPKVFRQRTVSPPRDRFGFVSDDDPFASPPPVQARAAPKASTGAPVRVAPPSTVDSGTISDDDPFASPPPVRRRTPIPELPANAPASPTNTNRGQKDVVDGPDTTKDDPATTTTAKTATVKPATTKLYLPRTSLDGLGYFKEIEVRRDDADRVLAEHNRSNTEKRRGQSRRAWRRSEIQVFDLTGED